MKQLDVCGRPWCDLCNCFHNGAHFGSSRGGHNDLGWCYRHDKYHAPLVNVKDLREEMD